MCIFYGVKSSLVIDWLIEESFKNIINLLAKIHRLSKRVVFSEILNKILDSEKIFLLLIFS